MSQKFCLVTLATGKCSGYIIGALTSPNEETYSPALDIRFNRSFSGWHDSTPHLHKNSEEYYVVIRGQINLCVDSVPVTIRAGQMLGVRAGVSHQVIGGEPPIENFIIRVPGGGNDKLVLNEGKPTRDEKPFILLDLYQTFTEYPVGACLPENHPNYSPRLDFTCVWDGDPVHEWRNERLHYHTLREEYYIVLRGRLDFQIGSDVVSVANGQVIGVKPYTIHKVLGGQGPVDILFVRVPGGRGDKMLAEA